MSYFVRKEESYGVWNMRSEKDQKDDEERDKKNKEDDKSKIDVRSERAG